MLNWFKNKKSSSTEDSLYRKNWLRSKRPKTFEAESENQALDRPMVFDPALRQHPMAFRAGEPRFESEEDAQKWYHLREQVLHFILRTVSNSVHADHLILRGSITLRSWLGDLARRPGDVDWIVTPSSWLMNDRASKELIDSIIKLLQGAALSDAIQIPDRPFAMEEIWTYEKAPGRRIIVPWKTDDSAFDGTVQMDFVFGEPVTSLPVTTRVQIGNLPPIEMQTASREQSLAWKLLWLATDIGAMGKDLYDAVLLAETSQLELPLLKRTFAAAGTPLIEPWAGFSKQEFQQLYVEWEDFQMEYPHITGTEEEWIARLIAALEPIWKQIEPTQSES